MRKGRASLTALAVASARALASGSRGAVVDPGDSSADQLLPAALARLLRAARLAPGAARATFGLVDHIALRTAIIDRLLLRALQDGVRQLVILGAGLDSRAHRLTELHAAVVYEVDHPDGQRVKRARARELPLTAAAVRYVPSDFEQLGLARRLAEAGQRKTEPSFFLLEGLLPYLRREVIERVLHELANVAAEGSQLCATYMTPDMFWLRRSLVRLSMRAIGEPVHAPLAADQIAALLGEIGFTVEHDSDTLDWARTLTPPGTRKPLMVYERLAWAVKR
jgi:methyltransferase (TIGR00027 family)